MPLPTGRRCRLALAALVVAAAAAVGCRGTTPTLFGYQLGADALYDPDIRTVYVPVFHSRAFQTTPYRGLEVEITRAVVREIGAKTRFKVVSDPDRADTELLGNVVGIDKVVLNRNQQNQIREADVVVNVDVLWRDLRDGRILSGPRTDVPPVAGLPVAPGQLPAVVPFDPSVPQPPPVCEVPAVLPVRVVATGRLLPELGETNASATKRVADQLATQIVSMMEKPW
jgi:hypothetical protein